MKKQLSKEEAIEFYESGTWKNMPDYEKVKLQLYQERLCMPFDVFHAAVEAALGHSVFTHEFAEIDKIRAEFERVQKSDKIKQVK